MTAAKVGAKKVVTAASKKLTASAAKILSSERGAIKLEALVGKGFPTDPTPFHVVFQCDHKDIKDRFERVGIDSSEIDILTI